MVLRFLIRFFTNNEHLVQRLSESYPVRRLAKFAVSLFMRGKEITEETGLKENLSPTKIKSTVKRFSQILKEDIEEVKKDFKKKW